MRKYTIREAIEEMKSSVQVFSDGYGTWKVKANIGLRSTGEYAEDYFTTHDESWRTGEFDGEKFNPQDFDEWQEDYFQPEFESVSSDALALITDEMKEEMFKAWCKKMWSDSSDDDNYESTDDRDERAAKKIIESWVDDNKWPDNVVVTADNSTIYVLDGEEKSFAESETANLAMLVDGRDIAFLNAFNSRVENA